MKKLSLLAAAFGMIASAQAGFNLNIDSQYQTAVLPSSGSITVTFTGTVDVLLPNFDITGASLEFPYANSSDFLNDAFDSNFLTYISGSSPGVDYSGALFTVTVTSTTPQGFYYLDSSGGLAELVVSGSNGTVSGSDNEFFGVNVVPEPATMAVLGLGAMALVHRRRK